MTHLPFCSVVMPCKDEIWLIEPCLQSLLANDYPVDRLEIIAVDGGSTDGTRDVLARYAERHPCLVVLDNPTGIIPVSMNLGIRCARGEVILKADAHTLYVTDYISRCVVHLLESGADNVGGVIETCASNPTVMGRTIARVLAHPFGSGNSSFRIGSDVPRDADTVAFGCYRRAVLERVGGYTEALVRSSDMDLNTRIRRAGGRILLVPEIVSRYHPRSRFWSFVARNWVDGFWATYPLKFGGQVLRARHAAPLAALILFALLGVVAVRVPAAAWVIAGLSSLYGALTLLASAQIGAREGSVRVAAAAPVVFAGRHAGYAFGSLWGILRALFSREFWFRRRSDGVAPADDAGWWDSFGRSGAISIVIPALNEAARLPAALEAIDAYLQPRVDYEIIVVDDGSTDRTPAVLAALAAGRPHLRTIRFPSNRGKGAAVRAGMLAASGRWLVFSDADQSTSIDQLRAVLEPVVNGFDVAIASRRLPDSAFLRRQGWRRRVLGRVFVAVTKALLVRGFRDSQCGFKAFTRDAASRIVSRVTSPTEIFDTEVLLVATRLGLRVAEVPVKWRDDPDSRLVCNVPRAIALLRELQRLRRYWGVVIPERAAVTAMGTTRLARRAIDLACSSLGLLVLSPVLLIIAAAIWLESGGPVLYRGQRIGLHGRPFVMLKFRTMCADAHVRGGTSTPMDDTRITPVGRRLRRYKLDELPQLLNVLKGDMSLVGPRPQVEWAVKLYTPEQRALLSVRPGITDYASIRFANESEILLGSPDPDRDYLEKIAPEKIRLGLEYVRTQSVPLDVRIVVATLWAIMGGDPDSVLRGRRRRRTDRTLPISEPQSS